MNDHTHLGTAHCNIGTDGLVYSLTLWIGGNEWRLNRSGFDKIDEGDPWETCEPAPPKAQEPSRTYMVNEIITLRSGSRLKVVELSGNHVWVDPIDSSIPGVACLLCGLMQRRDKQNNPCKGKVKLELRSDAKSA